MDDFSVLNFMHSLMRWLVLFGIGGAAVVSWRSLVLKTPIMVWERALTIAAMVLCHVQLVIGALLYMINYKSINVGMTGDMKRYWKFEHLGMMVIAILLVTLGRILSKRAKVEGAKQLLIAVFYTAALLLLLWSIPWPFTFMGQGRGWI